MDIIEQSAGTVVHVVINVEKTGCVFAVQNIFGGFRKVFQECLYGRYVGYMRIPVEVANDPR